MAAKKQGARHRAKPDPLAKAVGVRVRRLRMARQLDWDAWVEICGLGRGTLSEIERGLVVPGLHTLTKLAKALDLTVADLVIGDSIREQLFAATASLRDADVKALLREAERRRDKPGE